VNVFTDSEKGLVC